MAFVKPRLWSENELTLAALRSRKEFAESRKREGLDYYLISFERSSKKVEGLLEESDDLLDLEDKASELFQNNYFDVVRYLSSPAISRDDLKNLSGLSSVAYSSIILPDNASRLIDIIGITLDPKRFPWMEERRRPTQEEKSTAVVSTASLMASQEAQTNRRNLAKSNQENGVAEYLEGIGYAEVSRRDINTLNDAPGPYEYCHESKVAGKKADIVAGLGDGRFLALECKVSNSEVNSFKRLNHETVEKVMHWGTAFGRNGVVGAAVLAGVFNVSNLVAAQEEGVAIFWSFDLSPLGEFILETDGS